MKHETCENHLCTILSCHSHEDKEFGTWVPLRWSSADYRSPDDNMVTMK